MDIKSKREIITGARGWVERNLPEALAIQNESYSTILILTTIDAFAQMWRKYPPGRKNKETFCEFVLNYSTQKMKLGQICPVTLYYHYPSDTALKLQKGRVYYWNDPVLAEESNRILLKIDEEKREKAKREHTYVSLLYQLRNKTVHELNKVGTPIEFDQDIPTVVSGQKENGEPIWTLSYPRQWLFKLAQETINGFLDDCLKKEELLRFLDNERTINLTWYI